MKIVTFSLFSCILVIYSHAQHHKPNWNSGKPLGLNQNQNQDRYQPEPHYEQPSYIATAEKHPQSYGPLVNAAGNKNTYDDKQDYPNLNPNNGGYAEPNAPYVYEQGVAYSFDDNNKNGVSEDTYNKDDSTKDSFSKGGHFDIADNAAYTQQHIYHGQYQGHCIEDGFYYLDQATFVMCSNTHAHIQKCAAGSQNSGMDSYNFGDNYRYRDFCDVNLVDQGYGVQGHYSDLEGNKNQYFPAAGNKNEYLPAGNKNQYGGFAHAQTGYDVINEKPRDFNRYEPIHYKQQYIYHGKYEGICGEDGFYYKDQASFVICSNSNAYVQPCAMGSRNSGLDSYNFGDNYHYRDFCDINLIDHQRYIVDQGKAYSHLINNSHH